MPPTQEANSLFLEACHKRPSRKTPVWFMRQAGRYLPEYRELRAHHDLLTLCKTPELAAQITLLPVDILNVDAAIVFADLLLPLEPMGIPFHFAKAEGPVIEQPIRSEHDVDKLRPVVPEESLGYVMEAIRLVRVELSGRAPVIGFAGAPFTLASYLIEGGHSQNFQKTKVLMYERPELWNALLTKIAKVISDFLLAQIEAGADAVQLFDSWVGTLSPEDYRRFALPYSKQVLRSISKAGTPSIHFGTGTAGMLKAFQEAGGDVIGVDWRIRLDEAWSVLGHHQGIQGNLDPAALFAPLPILQEKVNAIMKMAGRRPGHIFNLGHGIWPLTPVDHVKAVVEWVKSYNEGG